MTRKSRREIERSLELLGNDDDGPSVGSRVTADFVDYGSEDPDGVPNDVELSEPETLGEGRGAATICVAQRREGAER